MSDYLSRFKAIAEEIKQHPDLELVEFKINPPASDKVFQDVEKRLGAPLAKGIQSFYAQANGFKLRWRIKSDLAEEELNRLREKYDDYWFEDTDNDDVPFANIHFIPLQECLVKRKWTELDVDGGDATIEFQKSTYNLDEFGKRLKPFDLYSTYQAMAFLLEEKNGSPKVMLLTNYYIEWDSSKITDFESYLEMLIATRGVCDAREKFYSEYRGDLKPELVTGKDHWRPRHVPKLFRPKKAKAKT